MDKAYTPSQHDSKWQQFWDAKMIAQPEVAKTLQKKKTGKTFSIVMPPPNVTGVLHQGHALGMALEDTLIRFRRMAGDEALFVPGTDHASIAVQMQVMKHLQSQGIEGRSLGREKFLEHCWNWIRDYQPRIYGQIKKLGASCDWSRVKFTLDPECNEAVTHAFVELYNQKLIYRAQKLVNWSPQGQTGLSDLEVKYEDRDAFLWHIKYPVVGEKDLFLTVATTRPETMLGDTAVAVHPEDERYKSLIGKSVELPLVGKKIPIVGDSYVDPAFGSGVVKITPAHDFNDFEVGERHQLPLVNIFTKQAKIVSGLGGEAEALAGLDRFEARKKVLALLEQKGLLEKTEKHKNRVGVSERWGDVVEPFLSYQWFCKVDTMAALAAKSAETGELKIVPSEFHNQFLRWMENIHDWCISRQLWWGHQIPAYHCRACSHIEVAKTAPAQCSQCKSDKIEQDEDVLDTWFSSALWPMSTLGWPQVNHPDFKKFYPTQVLETGFDILFFWVARMIMMGQHFTGKLPFDRVFMHPMVRDEDGQKMSKTKGNVIDPLEIIEDFGADTLRLTLNALCVQGRDLRLSQERLEVYRNFINKVWNATKFCLMQPVSGNAWRQRPKNTSKHLHDRWILTQLDATARELAKSWSEYRMQEAAETLYQFVWNDFCDWYLESVKLTRTDSQETLFYVLGEILKLLHPLIPHVTEELWHLLPGISSDESLATETFPEGEAFPDSTALVEHQFLRDMVGALRNLRAENKVAPNKKIPAYVSLVDSLSQKVIEENKAVISSLAKLEVLSVEKPQSGPTTKCIVRSVEAGKNIEIEVPVSGLVDLAEEKDRLKRELEQIKKWVAAQSAKLENKSFVDRAPPEVVEKEKIKLAEYRDKLGKTELALKNLG